MAKEGINREGADDPVRGDRKHDALRECGWTVLLCDPVCDRRDSINRIILEAGGRPQMVAAVNALDFSEVPACGHIALVAAGGASTQGHPGVEMVALLTGAGVKVIAYEDGVKNWPVRSKCLPLLTGATHLLDSANAEFATGLRQLLEKTFEALAEEQREQWQVSDAMRRHGMVGGSLVLANAFRAAMRFSELSDLPVLITGDSGTGKEMLARAIAKMDSKRRNGPFVTINCAAVSPTLMESEFFGHRRGAFTGAERDRKGLIRAAEGGVLFLDEIGELDIGLQAKLLRVLQENSVLGLGEEQEVAVNVRFIAATNRNLEQMVAERQFRADLFHRLRVLLIHIPPLRDRPADIPPLIEHFAQKHRALPGAAGAMVSLDFLEAARQLDLPGNARQLENLVRQSLVNHRGDGELDLNDLPVDVLRRLSQPPQAGGPPHAGGSLDPPMPAAVLRQLPPAELNELVKRILDAQGWNLSSTLRECEHQVFRAAMEQARGNQTQAARLLGITPRSVYNKVRKHHLPIPERL